MTRHTDIPPFARQHAPMHPSVWPKISREMEDDLAGHTPRQKVIGHFDKWGRYCSHRQQPQPRMDFLTWLTITSTIALVLLLAAAPVICLYP